MKIKSHLRLRLVLSQTLVIPKTMKLFWSTKKKITKDKNSNNVPNLEKTEVVLFYCNAINNDYQDNSKVVYVFAPTLVRYSLRSIFQEDQ